MTASPSAAHPRAGGENAARGTREAGSGGSSPRGRGKQRRLVGADRLGGLIPARAGKTVDAMAATLLGAAHPRAGGENSVKSVVAKPINGSSPRGRGKRPIQSVMGFG